MRVGYFVLLLMPMQWTVAQTETGRILPKVITLSLKPNATATIHLGLGYVSSVRLPDDVNSIVLGDPSRFRAEHADAEPRLVFLKTITEDSARSNALITTKSGETVELDLVGLGKVAESAQLDLFVDCRRERHPLVVSASERSLIRDTGPLTTAGNAAASLPYREPDLIGQELEKERSTSFPYRNRGQVAAVVGECTQDRQRMIVAFSVVNGSESEIELLPPQIELAGSAPGKKRKLLKTEPLVVSEFRITSRRIASGQRADGVVEFERPAFKEAGEALRLRLAPADKVDRPLILPIPFTASRQGDLP